MIANQIVTLEALNPTPTPTAAPELLTGIWRNRYTTSEELLGLGRFVPGVTTGEIYQCIQAAQGRVFNVAEIQGWEWFAPVVPKGIIAVAAQFTVVSDHRVNVNFNQLLFGSQFLMNYEIESFLSLWQHKPHQIPAIKFDLPERDQNGWLDITYLDHDLRIGRGSQGSLFVLERVTSGN